MASLPCHHVSWSSSHVVALVASESSSHVIMQCLLCDLYGPRRIAPGKLWGSTSDAACHGQQTGGRPPGPGGRVGGIFREALSSTCKAGALQQGGRCSRGGPSNLRRLVSGLDPLETSTVSLPGHVTLPSAWVPVV